MFLVKTTSADWSCGWTSSAEQGFSLFLLIAD
jgi:hypothetical protein